MRANRRRDTGPERALRSTLHAAGLRYRVDLSIKISGRRPIRPDVVFSGARVAVFVDGCFWHGCPEHGTTPVTRNSYWASKLDENRQRDARNTADLERAGWRVIRIWEHEAPETALARVLAIVGRRSPS